MLTGSKAIVIKMKGTHYSMKYSIYLFNTLTHKKERIVSFKPKEISMYTCGPTVYHYAHIGNLRSYIMEDVLEKTLNYIGYTVKRAMNITDVGHLTSDADDGNDKMLLGAQRENKSVMEIAKYYTDAFFQDCNKLNIKKPERVEPATNCIDEFISTIEELIKKGYAYLSGGNVYFDTSKLDKYYVFSEQGSTDLLVAVREDVSEDKNKRNKSDFVLWFTKSKFDSQELKWDSPWGMGYPGWHIECSCISVKHLGEYLDIHCGGVDNIFPHHTNEVAQTESLLGHRWCKYWFHVNHLKIQGGKMSKSDNNFLTVASLEEKGYNPLVYRMFCLQSHYRKPLMFSYDVLENVSKAYKKLISKISLLTEEGEIQTDMVEEYEDKFVLALCDDLNTANALSVVYEVLNSHINGNTKLQLLRKFDNVLSLNLVKKEEKCNIQLQIYVEEMLEKRRKAKQIKDFEMADRIRKQLLDEGIVIKDTRDGTKWNMIN